MAAGLGGTETSVNKQVKKIVQDLKMEIEVIKKTQTEGVMETENQGKRTGTTEASSNIRIQEIWAMVA